MQRSPTLGLHILHKWSISIMFLLTICDAEERKRWKGQWRVAVLLENSFIAPLKCLRPLHKRWGRSSELLSETHRRLISAPAADQLNSRCPHDLLNAHAAVVPAEVLSCPIEREKTAIWGLRITEIPRLISKVSLPGFGLAARIHSRLTLEVI